MDLAKNVSAFRVFRTQLREAFAELSNAVCFHRRVADMGDNALHRDTRRFPAAPFGLFELHFHKAGSPRT